MVTLAAPPNMPEQLTELWADVQAADQKRQVVRCRVDAVASDIADARQRLTEADEKKRGAVASELAALRSEAGVLPDEFEGALDRYALALHNWAKAGLEIAEGIVARGRREARAFLAGEAVDRDKVSAWEQASPEDRRSGRVKYLDASGGLQTVTSAPADDLTALHVRATGRAHGAERRAQKEAQPIRRVVTEGTRDGRRWSIFSAQTQSIGEMTGDRLTGHESWLQGQRRAVEKVLADAK